MVTQTPSFNKGVDVERDLALLGSYWRAHGLLPPARSRDRGVATLAASVRLWHTTRDLNPEPSD